MSFIRFNFLRILSKKNYNLPNIISLFRIVLIPFICYTIYQSATFEKYQLISYLLLFLILLSDFLDGWIARTFNRKTLIGQYLDPLADKLTLISISLLLLIVYDLPLWGYILLFLREAIITISIYYLFKKYKIAISPNLLGKISVLFSLITVFMYISQVKFRLIFFSLTLLISYISLLKGLWDYEKKRFRLR